VLGKKSAAHRSSEETRRRGYFVFGVPLGFRNLTPAPPPFSSMNSQPPDRTKMHVRGQ
jgi:hypothetical protein